MMSLHSVVIAEPVRPAIETFGGTLKDVPAVELGATAISGALKRLCLRREEIGRVVMGNAVQAGNKMNPARQATIHAGLPVQVPAMTVNRVCGCGAQAILAAAHEILMGSVNTAVAGGMENMDAAPYLLARGRWGHRMGDGVLSDSVLRDGLNDAFSDAHSGWHTEDLVTKFQIGRATQDEWALRSHQRFPAAQGAGKVADEIGPVEVPGRKGAKTFMVDEHNRPDATLESLSKLKSVFRESGTITAGNAPGLNTAAAAMVLASEAWAEKRGLTPMARLVAYGIAAVEPGFFGLWPIPAVKQALTRARWSVGDVERLEINECFAAITLAGMQELGLPSDAVNVEGGAIAHGHPIGAPGAVLPTRLLHSMRRDGLKNGVPTISIERVQQITSPVKMV